MSICAVVGASPEFNEKHFLSKKFDYIIAVDGGFAYLEKLGIVPDIAMGDFDSLGYIPRLNRVVRFSEEKDFTDMERALQRAHTRSCDEIYVYGALGGRFDHSLYNMQACAAISEKGALVTLISLDTAIRFLTGPDVFQLPCRKEGIVSVIALNDECLGVIEEGLKYRAEDISVTNRKTWGISNEFIGSEYSCVALEQGTLGIIYPLEEESHTTKEV